jgi:hypothetical protein
MSVAKPGDLVTPPPQVTRRAALGKSTGPAATPRPPTALASRPLIIPIIEATAPRLQYKPWPVAFGAWREPAIWSGLAPGMGGPSASQCRMTRRIFVVDFPKEAALILELP